MRYVVCKKNHKEGIYDFIDRIEELENGDLIECHKEGCQSTEFSIQSDKGDDEEDEEEGTDLEQEDKDWEEENNKAYDEE